MLVCMRPQGDRGGPWRLSCALESSTRGKDSTKCNEITYSVEEEEIKIGMAWDKSQMASDKEMTPIGQKGITTSESQSEVALSSDRPRQKRNSVAFMANLCRNENDAKFGVDGWWGMTWLHLKYISRERELAIGTSTCSRMRTKFNRPRGNMNLNYDTNLLELL